MSEGRTSTIGVPGKGRIGKQIQLPLSKAVEISLKSLRIRFWRSMLTVSSVILAIAFLTFVWTSGRVQSSVAVNMRGDAQKASALLADVDEHWRPMDSELSGRFAAKWVKWAKTYRKARQALDGGSTGALKDLVYESGHFDKSVALAEDKVVSFDGLSVEPKVVEDLATRAREIGLDPDVDFDDDPEDRGLWKVEALRLAGVKAATQAEVNRFNRLNLALQKMGLDPAASQEKLREMSWDTVWLISISLLVCGVGIVNAMLMSVTERFREIGTMKCLGALDSFIVKLFLLESTFQGIAGTVFGVIIGLVVMVATGLMRFGRASFTYFPGGQVVMIVVYALLIGAALSIAAAVFPALRAAHMAPVEAMRVEE